jgi:hypothetical protein
MNSASSRSATSRPILSPARHFPCGRRREEIAGYATETGPAVRRALGTGVSPDRQPWGQRSRTRSPRGWEQQISTLPPAGSSTGSGV